MKRAALLTLAQLLFIAYFTSAGVAQGPSPEDYVIVGQTAATGHLLLASPGGGGKFSTLQTFSSQRPTWVGMLQDNRSLGILVEQLTATRNGLLLKYRHGAFPPLTTLTAITTGGPPVGPTSFCWDWKGHLMFTVSDRYLLKYEPTQPGTYTTFYTHTTLPCRLDQVITPPGSDYVLLNKHTKPPFLFSVGMDGKFRATLEGSHLSDADSVSFDYQHQRFLISHSARGALLALKNAKVTTLTTLSMVPIVHRHTRRNTVVVLGRNALPTSSFLQEIDLNGKVVNTLVLKTGTLFYPTGFEIQGNNKLHCYLDLATNPGTIVFELNNPAVARKPYILALSFGYTGFNTGKCGWLHLTPDTLFMLTGLGLIPLVTNGIGILDPNGFARASFQRPHMLPQIKGLTLYAAWVAYDSTGILSVSETEHFVLP